MRAEPRSAEPRGAEPRRIESQREVSLSPILSPHRLSSVCPELLWTLLIYPRPIPRPPSPFTSHSSPLIASRSSPLAADCGRVSQTFNDAVRKWGMAVFTSAGNDGPALSTLGAPGHLTAPITVGAYISPAMMGDQYSMLPPSAGEEEPLPTSYSFSSRGPTPDGWLPTLCAPGGAIAPVPRHTLQVHLFPQPRLLVSPPISSLSHSGSTHLLYLPILTAGQGAVPRHKHVVAKRVRRRGMRPLGPQASGCVPCVCAVCAV